MKLGIINVNKPSGVSSGYVVQKIKRLTGMPCGHMGTLDPLASGVLPVAVGNAARLFDYLLQKKKQYIATFRFGVTSDTLDSTGELAFLNPYGPTAAALEAIKNFDPIRVANYPHSHAGGEKDGLWYEQEQQPEEQQPAESAEPQPAEPAKQP